MTQEKKPINTEQMYKFKTNLNQAVKDFSLNYFNTTISSAISRGNKPSNKDLEFLIDGLNKGKKQYIKAAEKGNKKKQTIILKEISDAEKQWDNIRKFRQEWTKSSLDKKRGITSDFKASRQGQDLANIIAGNVQPTVNEDGVYGYYVFDPGNPDEKKWTSLRDINLLVNHHSYDNKSRIIMESMAGNMINMSTEIDAGDFNRDATRHTVRTNIIEKGNIRSLIHDEHVPGRTFYKDLQELIKNQTQGQLGISLDSIVDPTPENGITSEDAKQIADGIVLNKDMRMHYLTEYYTNYMENNWNVGAKNRPSKEEETNKVSNEFNTNIQ